MHFTYWNWIPKTVYSLHYVIGIGISSHWFKQVCAFNPFLTFGFLMGTLPKDGLIELCSRFTLREKWCFPLRIFSVNVTNLGHIYWRNPESKISFFLRCYLDSQGLVSSGRYNKSPALVTLESFCTIKIWYIAQNWSILTAALFLTLSNIYDATFLAKLVND